MAVAPTNIRTRTSFARFSFSPAKLFMSLVRVVVESDSMFFTFACVEDATSLSSARELSSAAYVHGAYVCAGCGIICSLALRTRRR